MVLLNMDTENAGYAGGATEAAVGSVKGDAGGTERGAAESET